MTDIMENRIAYWQVERKRNEMEKLSYICMRVVFILLKLLFFFFQTKVGARIVITYPALLVLDRL